MIFDKILQKKDGEMYSILDIITGNKDTDNYIYTLAEAHAIDLIARTIAKNKINTYENKDNKIIKTKGNLYWALNVQPNLIESASKFWYKAIVKLLIDGKLLIIINKTSTDNYLFVADNYIASNDILYGKRFSNVQISDNEGHSLNLFKNYDNDSSIYLTLEQTELANVSTNFKTNMNKVLKASQKNYTTSNTPKWRLKNPGRTASND